MKYHLNDVASICYHYGSLEFFFVCYYIRKLNREHRWWNEIKIQMSTQPKKKKKNQNEMWTGGSIIIYDFPRDFSVFIWILLILLTFFLNLVFSSSLSSSSTTYMILRDKFFRWIQKLNENWSIFWCFK